MNELLKRLDIEYQFEVEDEQEAIGIVKEFFDTLGLIVDYVSQEKKEIIADIIIGNLMYEDLGHGGLLVTFDDYDWNTLCLFYQFAEFVLEKVEPDSDTWQDFFKKSNADELKRFKNGKHDFVRLPKPSLNSLLDLINIKGGFKKLSKLEKGLLIEYSKLETQK